MVAASPRSGVNTITGEGLAEAVTGAQVVVNVSNAPSWEDAAVMKFFETSTPNVLVAEADAGVPITSRCPWWAPSVCRIAATFAQTRSGAADRPPATSLTRSFVRRSSWSSSAASRSRAPRRSCSAAFGIDAAHVGRRRRGSDGGLHAGAATAPNCRNRRSGRPIAGLTVRTYLAVHQDTRQVITDESARYYGRRSANDRFCRTTRLTSGRPIWKNGLARRHARAALSCRDLSLNLNEGTFTR